MLQNRKKKIKSYKEDDYLGGYDPYSASKAAAEIITFPYEHILRSKGIGVATARAGKLLGFSSDGNTLEATIDSDSAAQAATSATNAASSATSAASSATAATNAKNAAERRRKIAALETENIHLFNDFKAAVRQSEGISSMLRNSKIYPLCGRGDVNLYTVFTESNRSHLGKFGLSGCVVPTGIATDDTTKFFFQDLIKKKSLKSLFDFVNTKGFFPTNTP